MDSSYKSKANKFHPHCPSQAQLESYVAKNISSKLVVEIEHKLNNCGEDTCLCSEVIEGLELEKIALQIKQNEPELAEGFDTQKVYQNIKHLFENAEAQKPIPISKPINRSLSSNYVMGIAAVLVLFILVFWWIQNPLAPTLVEKNRTKDSIDNRIKKQSIDNQSVNENKATPEETINELNKPSIKPDKQLAFAENADLETDLSAQARVGEEIRILAPQNNENFAETVKLTWHAPQAQIFEVEILDNQRRRISLQTLAKGQTKLVLEVKNWQAGLYYWRLSDENDLLYTGKFKVKE
jgi:hypothetical protein